jgi:hypothetical protein
MTLQEEKIQDHRIRLRHGYASHQGHDSCWIRSSAAESFIAPTASKADVAAMKC